MALPVSEKYTLEILTNWIKAFALLNELVETGGAGVVDFGEYSGLNHTTVTKCLDQFRVRKKLVA